MQTNLINRQLQFIEFITLISLNQVVYIMKLSQWCKLSKHFKLKSLDYYCIPSQ